MSTVRCASSVADEDQDVARSNAVERFARANIRDDERLDFAAEVVLGPHPVLSQMLFSLTMGGPRPRTANGYLHPNHGVAILTDRRLFVVAYGRTVMEVPRGLARARESGGSAVMPWVDVRWGHDVVRTAFHWGRARRDRFAELLGAQPDATR